MTMSRLLFLFIYLLWPICDLNLAPISWGAWPKDMDPNGRPQHLDDDTEHRDPMGCLTESYHLNPLKLRISWDLGPNIVFLSLCGIQSSPRQGTRWFHVSASSDGVGNTPMKGKKPTARILVPLNQTNAHAMMTSERLKAGIALHLQKSLINIDNL